MSKKDTKFEIDQVLALRELEKARMKKGLHGFKKDFQEFLRRYMDGGEALTSDDPRQIQAKVLWDKGFDHGFESFEAYLATIPEIPETLLVDDSNLPLLRLVDPRLGLVKTCELFGIKFKEFGYSDADAVACDNRHEIPSTPFWVRANDGRKNRNRRPDVCRDECKDEFLAMTDMVAIMTWVQDPSIIKENEHILDCPGSVHRAGRGYCACLGVWHGEVELVLSWGAGDADPRYGSGAFRRE